jgi:hypothetical protein
MMRNTNEEYKQKCMEMAERNIKLINEIKELKENQKKLINIDEQHCEEMQDMRDKIDTDFGIIKKLVEERNEAHAKMQDEGLFGMIQVEKNRVIREILSSYYDGSHIKYCCPDCIFPHDEMLRAFKP